jgi:hypothetical protein
MTVCGRSRHWCLDAVGTPNTGRLSNCEPPVNNPAAGVRQFRASGKPGVTEDTERWSARRPAGFRRARRTPAVSRISSPRSKPWHGGTTIRGRSTPRRERGHGRSSEGRPRRRELGAAVGSPDCWRALQPGRRRRRPPQVEPARSKVPTSRAHRLGRWPPPTAASANGPPLAPILARRAGAVSGVDESTPVPRCWQSCWYG